jgi:electron transfer flavoprotein alpha subunit
MANILIVAEHSAGKIKKYSIELAGKASELAKQMGGTLTAVFIGDGVETFAKEMGHYGVSKVITASHSALKNYSGEGYSKVLGDIIDQEKPDIVLGTASSLGKDLLARTAMRLNAGLASDCIDMKIENGRLAVRRPIYAGKAIIDVVPEGKPQMATSRPNTYPVPEPRSDSPTAAAFAADPGTIKARVKELVEAEVGMLDLTEAERIVSGGRAMAAKENFKLLTDLAKVIGASVGASRAAVDAGFASHDHQVGQTGKTVNPTLYIACGISGAIQHLAGMRTSKVIVAINKDPEAPIFLKADYGIVGDLFKVVPVLTEQFKKLLQE